MNFHFVLGSSGKDKDKAPAATELIAFMGTTEFTNHQPHVQCGALGNKIPREWQSWGDYWKSFITPEYVASITSPQAWIDWWNSPAHANDDYIWTKKSAGYFYAGIDTSDVSAPLFLLFFALFYIYVCPPYCCTKQPHFHAGANWRWRY